MKLISSHSVLSLALATIMVTPIAFAAPAKSSSTRVTTKTTIKKAPVRKMTIKKVVKTTTRRSTARRVVRGSGARTLPGGLQITDLKVGRGAVARSGDTVSVHYRGTLTNGTEFDQSYKRGEPFSFTLGAGQVIRGWDQGVAGMRVGGKRRMVIPSSLGYGAQGAGNAIPPNATLVFMVELLKVQQQ